MICDTQLEKGMIMPDANVLSFSAYSAVFNGLSLAVAAMLAGTLFFFFSRTQVGFKYRPALLVSALVTAIACYHYFRIFNSWVEAHAVQPDKTFVLTNITFNDAYRYMDWILTVPLLLVELVAVLGLPKEQSRGLLGKLAIAAFLMIALGYPGELQTNLGLRTLWGTLSTIPFVYILFVLWKQLGASLETQPETVKPLVRGARLLTLASWGFYPLAYMIPLLGNSLPYEAKQVGIQVGYTIADIIAKVGLGVFIYFIAMAKTENDAKTGAASFEQTFVAA